MSLVYTEGYLNSIVLGTDQQKLESDIKNILIVPPKDNSIDIIVSIYEYSPFEPIYEIHLFQESVFLKGKKMNKNTAYYGKVSNSKVQLYYEKEEH